MNKTEAKKRIEKLSAEINKIRYDYHVLDKPDVTDEIYDSLMAELRGLEKNFPEYKFSNSPTQRIGGKPISKFEKTVHQVRQWSFDDVFDFQELQKWEEKIIRMKEKIPEIKNEKLDYIAEIKIDGLKIILNYKDGIFERGATRGDGIVGEDVSENIRTIYSVPLELKSKVNLIAVGECWLSKKELERINNERKKRGEALFANSRNAAAGSIRQLNPKIAASRKLDAFVYDIDYITYSMEYRTKRNEIPKTQLEELQFLEKLGFNVNQEYKLCKNIKEIEEYYQSWIKRKDREDYGIDGVVIKINSRKIQEALGYTGKSPRFGVAYKFPAEKTTTVVEGIDIQIGRTGALTPVAHLRPVKIAGSVVSRATLHNEDEIKKLDVRIGDTVVIRKAGDIIPEVVETLKNLRTGKEKKFKMPEICPICGSKVKRENLSSKESKINFSAAAYCTNSKCFAKEKEKIIHFVSKKGFNIDGFGEKIVEQFMNEGLVSKFSDIFELKYGDLEPLERFAQKSAENLIKAIQKSKKIKLSKFLFALGIRHLGEEGAILLVQNLEKLAKNKIKNIQDFIKYFSCVKKEDLESIKGVGEKMAESIVSWFGDHENIQDLKKMKELGIEIIMPSLLQKRKGKLQNLTFVLTGELKNFTRDIAKDIIRREGGTVSSSVSKKADYILVGEKPGSKFEKAKKLGVKILSENDFKKLIK